MQTMVLKAKITVPAPRDEVFPFFADAHNLEELTPDLLRFRVLTPAPIPMAVGTLIDYRLKLRGIPIRWKTLIGAWRPPFEFIDMQLKGPYRHWHHRHTFEETSGGTELGDIVHYAVSGGPLAPWIERSFVRGDVEKIFRHRMEKICARFGGDPAKGSVTVERVANLQQNLPMGSAQHQPGAGATPAAKAG